MSTKHKWENGKQKSTITNEASKHSKNGCTEGIDDDEKRKDFDENGYLESVKI